MEPPLVIKDLVGAGLLTEEQVKEVQDAASKERVRLEQAAVDQGHLTEREFLKFVAETYGYEYLEKLDEARVPEMFLTQVSIRFARQFQTVAVRLHGGTIRVATSRPLDVHPLDDISRTLNTPVTPVLSPREEIEALINRAYSENPAALIDVLGDTKDIGKADVTTGTEDLLDAASQAPIIKLVNTILFRALKMRASDIHLHPYKDQVKIRYRIDGVLYDQGELPRRLLDAVVTRVKVLGKMDIAERRLPQDGRASYTLGDNEIDLRIATVPTAEGERIVFRILDKGSRLYTLDELGVDPQTLALFRRSIAAPNGIILVTGPTGSGKTTTLYAALDELNAAEKNILTIEDPIEYNLEGISQVQVSNKKGLNFSTGLRAFLRQDPDVMMVGEIRDLETARIAIQSAQTGHLVFSTLHTNDSAGAITRMLDIGIEPYLVSSSIRCVLAQRLVRRICETCKVTYQPEEELVESLGIMGQLPDGIMWRGEGCERCMSTGYWDRTGIYELMALSERIQTLVSRRASSTEIKKHALIEGMRTLRIDGLDKSLAGITTMEEVLAVTFADMKTGAEAS